MQTKLATCARSVSLSTGVRAFASRVLIRHQRALRTHTRQDIIVIINIIMLPHHTAVNSEHTAVACAAPYSDNVRCRRTNHAVRGRSHSSCARVFGSFFFCSRPSRWQCVRTIVQCVINILCIFCAPSKSVGNKPLNTRLTVCWQVI